MKAYYKIFLLYLSVVLFVSFWVYSVFSTDLFFDAKINLKNSLSKNLFLDDNKLNWNTVFYSSTNNLSKYKINSFCKNISKFIGRKDDIYIFEFKILDKNCKTNFVYLERDKKAIKKSFIKFNLFTKSKLFDFYADRDNLSLNKLNSDLEKLLEKNKKLLEDKNVISFKKLKIQRKIEELKYQKNFLEKILKQRQKKFITPVSWYKINHNKNKIPNAWRPYRASYTDWIHHGWDVMAPLNTPVQALAYGKIIRIVRDFKFSDLEKVKRKNLNKNDKTINLDILRWNQVWLKTASWDVVFYAHLRNIPKSLKIWDIVEAGTKLWEVWISWVPDKHYTDYHLHFAIMKNPKIKRKVWKYDFLDIMNWDWYFKNKSSKYILENEDNIFE